MTSSFKINEIFYSLQGEGFFTGTPSLFIRFSGCNLHCPFCDTQHNEGTFMTVEEIVRAADSVPASHVVLTGGEPSLFVTEELTHALKAGGKRFLAMETNGTHAITPGVDWITLSPKFEFTENAQLAIQSCDELKVVYTGQDLTPYENIQATHRFLQPCDTGDAARNREIIERTVQTCLDNPQWRLSLQTHKVLQIR